MDYQLIGNEFLKKYYFWRLSEAEREVSEGLPFLQKMKNPYIQQELAALLSFSEADQLCVLKSLIKISTFPQLLAEVSDEITVQEAQLLKMYNLKRLRVRRNNPEIDRLFDVEYEAENFKEFKIKELKEVMISSMGEVFDQPFRRVDRRHISYITHYKGWTVSSDIEFDPIYYHYHHQIYRFDDGHRTVLGGRYSIALNEWLGFSNYGTWCFTAPSDPRTAAEAIAYLCSYFLSFLPMLLT